MKIKKLILPNTFIIEPKVFYDKRGFLYEIWRQDLYFKNKIKFKIVQVLHSYSKKNTLRGIHFQFPNLQGKQPNFWKMVWMHYRFKKKTAIMYTRRVWAWLFSIK